MTETGTAVADLQRRLVPVALRPGLWGLRDDHAQITAFVTGCGVGAPGALDQLAEWAVARIGGARDKYGWPYAVAVLAAARVAGPDGRTDPRTPLAGAFLHLVCEYLADMEQPGGPERARADHAAARARYLAAHELEAHVDGADLLDPAWHEECAAW